MERTLAPQYARRSAGFSPAVRWLLGAAILGQAVHLAIVLGVIGSAAVAGGGNPVGHLALGIGELIAHFLVSTVLIAVALLVLIRHAQESDRLDERQRRRWLVALALWGPVTMPVYWWRYVRPA